MSTTVLDDWGRDNISEQRRVPYVAASRAKRVLSFGAGLDADRVAGLIANNGVPLLRAWRRWRRQPSPLRLIAMWNPRGAAIAYANLVIATSRCTSSRKFESCLVRSTTLCH